MKITKNKIRITLIVGFFWLLTLLVVVNNGYSLKFKVKVFNLELNLELTKNQSQDKQK